LRRRDLVLQSEEISHEVVYGVGAMSFSWPVLNPGKVTQRDIVAGLL
jgi:hypothetical protein